MNPAVKRAIAEIPADAWTTIEYTDAVFNETTSTWVSRAEVAEIGFTAFSSRKKTSNHGCDGHACHPGRQVSEPRSTFHSF